MAAYVLKSFGNSVAGYLKRASNCNGFRNTRVNFSFSARGSKTVCQQPQPYITRLALPPDYENVVEFMCNECYPDDPVIINRGIACTEVPPVWRKMMNDQVRCGLSIIAENRDHCIIGAALNCAITDMEIQMMYDLAKCCAVGPIQQVIEFFGYVSEESSLWERYDVRLIFEQSSLAVSKEYRRMGIAKRLLQASYILARDCGFKLFRLDCNSRYCARICESFGWEEAWSVPFSQFVSNGKVVFENVKEPHTVCRVFVNRLNDFKTFCPGCVPL